MFLLDWKITRTSKAESGLVECTVNKEGGTTKRGRRKEGHVESSLV